jgi:citrate lyase subunit beta/citryl-CoA lyase
MSRDLDTARSLLFVPATRPERYAKAHASGADAVIIDLEDAVASADKERARELLNEAWPRLSGHAHTLVRVNGADTEYHRLDLELCAALRPAALVVPKADIAALVAVHRALPGARLIALVESAAALREVDAIAALPGVQRLAFGALDFQSDLGMQCGEDEAELAPVRVAMVVASRIAGIAAPIDGVTLETRNRELVRSATERSRRFGFGARLCIHPSQVAPVHEGFAPDAVQLAWAERVLEAVALAARAAGSELPGAIEVDGRMVDAPVIRLARQTLAQAGRDG